MHVLSPDRERALLTDRGFSRRTVQFMIKVKICGIREVGDALTAFEAGANYVGMVFVPGRRRKIDKARGLEIVSALELQIGTPKTVGLFADQSLNEVEQTVQHCGLDMVQLCGTESLGYSSSITVPVIKVLHVSDESPVEAEVDRLSVSIAALREEGQLASLDSKVDGLQGGTGRKFNWRVAKALSSEGFSFFLAGGLTPVNVSSAVSEVRPWGVDVSGGVETGGNKDSDKIKEFIKAVHREPYTKSSPLERL